MPFGVGAAGSTIRARRIRKTICTRKIRDIFPRAIALFRYAESLRQTYLEVDHLRVSVLLHYRTHCFGIPQLDTPAIRAKAGMLSREPRIGASFCSLDPSSLSIFGNPRWRLFGHRVAEFHSARPNRRFPLCRLRRSARSLIADYGACVSVCFLSARRACGVDEQTAAHPKR